MGSGFCEFCQMWHSASCGHPGRRLLDDKDKEIAALKEQLDECQKSKDEDEIECIACKMHYEEHRDTLLRDNLELCEQIQELQERLEAWRALEITCHSAIFTANEADNDDLVRLYRLGEITVCDRCKGEIG